MNTVYLKRRPTRAEFFVSRDGTRENARSYAVVDAKTQKSGAFALSTRGTHGDAQCHLVPSERRAIGYPPLRGALMLGSQSIAAVSIQHEMNAPFIKVESDTVEVLAEREPFRDPYAPVLFKSIRHGVIAEVPKSELSLSELWRSRLGFGRVRWGTIEAPEPLDKELEIILQVMMTAYEFIVEPRYDSTDSIGS